MATLDIILLLCFLPALYRGITKGFVEQIVGIVSVIAGAYLAFLFTQPASGVIGGWFPSWNKQVVNIVSFILIFIAVAVVLRLVGKLIESILSFVSLSWFNRLLGLVFSVALTALVLSLLVYAFDGLNAQWGICAPEDLEQSSIYKILHDISLKVFPFLQDLLSHGNA